MSNEARIIEVKGDDDGQRLDRWLKRVAPDLPYVLVQKLLRKGQIRIDGKRAKPDTRLEQGQEVRLPPKDCKSKPVNKTLNAEDIAYIKSLVIYDDGDVVALNKPYDLAVQGGTKMQRHVDGLLEGLKNKEGIKPRLVHRLDKDTSGVLLLARSSKVAKALGESFKRRDVKKIYWALVSPVPEIYDGTIKAPLIKAGGKNKERMRIADHDGDEEDAKMAITDYRVLDVVGSETAFIAFWPRTGRTHQIRVHAEYMNCPIIGDPKYKNRDIVHEHEHIDLQGMHLAGRLHLHARRIILAHPVNNSVLDISAPLPPDLDKSWKTLGFDTHYTEDPFADMRA